MIDVKVGGRTFSNIDRLEFINADTNENVYFMEAEVLMLILQSNASKALEYYENQYINAIGASGATEWITPLFGTLYLPNATSSATSAKFNCETLVLPKLTEATNQIFYGANLKIVDLSALTSISGNYTFAGRTLIAVILRGNAVPSFASGATVTNYKTGVALYVPSSMISAYQENSVWASLVNDKSWTINAIEGSEYEDVNWFKQ